MRSVKAVFIKQAKDLLKNKLVLLQFLVMPVMALALTELVAKPEATIPNGMFVVMFASIFMGMVLPMATMGAIVEDHEQGSLRFLVMAGVRPVQYLTGIAGVMVAASIVVLTAFGLMGSGIPFARFVALMLLGAVASMLLGGVVGLMAGNQQAATGIGMPIAMILGFGPMIAMFNSTVGRVFAPFYTMQISQAVGDASASLTKPLVIVLVNIAVLTALFIFAYTKKGLRN